MEEWIHRAAEHVAFGVDVAAILVIAFGAFEAVVGLFGVGFGKHATHGARKAVWRRFGVWLLLGLEFELAADVIESIVSPSWQDIGKLGAIAVIRTFLNYFLEKDLEASAAEVRNAETVAEDNRR